MKMKKFISSLTAAVMAATTVLTSALVTPAMSFMASAADDDAFGQVWLAGSIGGITGGVKSDEVSVIADGTYTVSVDNMSEMDGYNQWYTTIQTLYLESNINSYTYENIKINIDSIVIDGTEAEYTQSFSYSLSLFII